MPTGKRFRKAAIATGATVALGAAALVGLGPVSSIASSHREAPLISNDPQADNTDVYAFVSPDRPSTVTVISNFIPFEEPAGGPNFYRFAAGARYNVKVSNDNDAAAEVTFQWRFHNHYRTQHTFLYNTGAVTTLDDENLNFFQTYDLVMIRGGKTRMILNEAPVAPSNVGKASMPNYTKLSNEAISGYAKGAGKSWAGQADDPFFLDLRVFDLLYGGDLSEVGDDTLAGFNVNSIALQVPKNWIARGANADKNPIVGIWSTVERKKVTVKAGGTAKTTYRQVSRLGMPLVNEVVIPLANKDRWNRSKPRGDDQFGKYVVDPELPKLIEAIYGIPAPETPRDDLVSVFLTGVEGLNQPSKKVEPAEMIRLNMGIAPCQPKECDAYSPLGVIKGDVAGFPNGRRLADDTIDVALRVVEGALRPDHPKIVDKLGDGVRHNDREFRGHFPYVALPWSGSAPSPH